MEVKKRRGLKKAIIGIARMLLTAIYQILKKSVPYDTDLYKKVNFFPSDREISEDQVVFVLQKLGYQVVRNSL